MTDELLKELTKERSLWAVYKVSRSLPTRKGYVACELVASALVGAGAALSDASASQLADKVRAWSDLGFGFAIAILGFLLAGYTIFAALSGAEFVRDLVENKHPKTGLPYLKYSTLQFMQVFVHYLGFLILHLCIVLLGWRGGLFTKVLEFVASSCGHWVWRSASIGSTVLVGWFLVHLWFILQSFVFNIYSSVMTMARLRLTEKPPTPMPALTALRDELERLLGGD